MAVFRTEESYEPPVFNCDSYESFYKQAFSSVKKDNSKRVIFYAFKKVSILLSLYKIFSLYHGKLMIDKNGIIVYNHIKTKKSTINKALFLYT